jgi:hypothetical protein
MVQKKGFQERHVWVAFQVHKRRGAVQRNNRPISVERAKGAVHRLDKLTRQCKWHSGPSDIHEINHSETGHIINVRVKRARHPNNFYDLGTSNLYVSTT